MIKISSTRTFEIPFTDTPEASVTFRFVGDQSIKFKDDANGIQIFWSILTDSIVGCKGIKDENDQEIDQEIVMTNLEVRENIFTYIRLNDEKMMEVIIDKYQGLTSKK